MTISVEAKRQLLSAVQMLLRHVELLNGKALRSHAQAECFFALNREAKLQEAATTEAQTCLLKCIHELFGPEVASFGVRYA